MCFSFDKCYKDFELNSAANEHLSRRYRLCYVCQWQKRHPSSCLWLALILSMAGSHLKLQSKCAKSYIHATKPGKTTFGNCIVFCLKLTVLLLWTAMVCSIVSLPNSDGAIFWSWCKGLPSWCKSDCMDWTMMTCRSLNIDLALWLSKIVHTKTSSNLDMDSKMPSRCQRIGLPFMIDCLPNLLFNLWPS